MDREAQSREVDRNYEIFERLLPDLLKEHRDQYALMKSLKIVGFYDNAGEAYDAAKQRFGDDTFSIQEVTDEPIYLTSFWPAHRQCEL